MPAVILKNGQNERVLRRKLAHGANVVQMIDKKHIHLREHGNRYQHLQKQDEIGGFSAP